MTILNSGTLIYPSCECLDSIFCLLQIPVSRPSKCKILVSLIFIVFLGRHFIFLFHISHHTRLSVLSSLLVNPVYDDYQVPLCPVIVVPFQDVNVILLPYKHSTSLCQWSVFCYPTSSPLPIDGRSRYRNSSVLPYPGILNNGYGYKGTGSGSE